MSAFAVSRFSTVLHQSCCCKYVNIQEKGSNARGNVHLEHHAYSSDHWRGSSVVGANRLVFIC